MEFVSKKKPEPKPLFDVKQDFYDSLDQVCHEAITLSQAVDMALKA